MKKSLKERFELESRRELYLSEFSTRKRKSGEGWAEYADELRVLADKAFPELEEKAREQLALNQYLSHLQVAFNVKQKWPANLVEAVGATLEIDSYLPQPSKVASVEVREDPVVSAVQSKQDSMMGMLQAMMERFDRLENQPRSRPNPTATRLPNRASTIVCHRCGQEGCLEQITLRPKFTHAMGGKSIGWSGR